MAKRGERPGNAREHIAATAARIMAEDGIDDFALAKRKALRQLGIEGRVALPANDEIEEQLRAYRALYQAEEHGSRIASLRRAAVDAMKALARFRPYLTGSVLAGTAGPYAEVELQLFPDDSKQVEFFLLENQIAYEARNARRYSGDQTREAAVLSFDWQGARIKASVYDARDERTSLKTSLAGRVATRAGLAEVQALVALDESRQT
jgi:hypothetical protein